MPAFSIICESSPHTKICTPNCSGLFYFIVFVYLELSSCLSFPSTWIIATSHLYPGWLWLCFTECGRVCVCKHEYACVHGDIFLKQFENIFPCTYLYLSPSGFWGLTVIVNFSWGSLGLFPLLFIPIANAFVTNRSYLIDVHNSQIIINKVQARSGHLVSLDRCKSLCHFHSINTWGSSTPFAAERSLGLPQFTMVSLACTRTSNKGSCISLILLVWFLSFQKTLSEAHALLVLGICSFLWLNKDWSVLRKSYSLFIHSLVGWHFDWFQFGPIVNKAAISIFIPERWYHVFRCFFFYLLRKHLTVRSNGFNFTLNLPPVEPRREKQSPNNTLAPLSPLTLQHTE